jgi:DNA-binding transcriptional LysR family regulator
MDHLTQLKALVAVAEEGSFSAAARTLATTQPSVSKGVAELETRLGTRLLHRTTRSLKLTEAGADYYKRVKHMLDLWAAADADAAGEAAGIKGRLRINAPGLLAGRFVMPAIARFRERFRTVTVALAVDDRRVDPVQEDTDIAIRIGKLEDSTLLVRRVGSVRTGLYVSPDYMALQTERASPSAGLELELIRFSGQSASGRVTAPFADPAADEFSLAWSPSVTVSNGLQAREAAIGGAGVAVLPWFLTAAV